ncbi:transglycosylase domain-containing protein [Streptomyces sp. 4F14]|uniref:transglycosylase domain-containing protein n=1 Tax=Streptomyces sp. 4F14 TaxID=3394380 RepID=UPI003A83C32F
MPGTPLPGAGVQDAAAPEGGVEEDAVPGPGFQDAAAPEKAGEDNSVRRERRWPRHAGRVPLRRRLRRTRGRWLRRFALAGVVLLMALCGAALVAYRLTEIPEPHPETVTQSTVFTDGKGAYLGRRGPVDRQEVPLSQVPRYVQDAVIAAENRSFRTDKGVSPKAVARAVLASVTGGARQGGSTITQQYVKNALLTPEQSMSRKLREALIAIKLDRTRSKDEILAGYLNTVYFGRGSAGIEAAARNYFGVGTRDLTVSQGAALAAIVNIPSYYEKAGSDPRITAKLQGRWEWVLDAMEAGGSITRTQRDEAVFPAFRFYPPGTTEGQRQYMIDVAAKEAARELGISGDELARGGYTVRTTFDLALQDAATEAVKSLKGRAGTRLHTAVVGIRPGDGAVRLLYGGADYARQPFNDAVDGAVEAGTAAEPFSRLELDGPLGKLGETAAPTPLKLASAYATVAADGVYATPYTVASITRGGRTLYTARPETRRAFTEKEALATMYSWAAPKEAAGEAYFTGGAGGGITRRTVWSTRLDDQLSLTAVLFADRPGKKKNTTVPAQLPNSPAPTETAEGIVGQLWGLTDGGVRPVPE